MRRFVFLFALALIIMGCSQDDANQTDKDIIKVSLKLNGDIVSSDSPITRADTESRDLIGIAVYKGTEKFAYGIFDNLNDVSIYLKAGSKYKFKCTLIKEAKDKLYFYRTDETSPYRFQDTYPMLHLPIQVVFLTILVVIMCLVVIVVGLYARPLIVFMASWLNIPQQ